ncbi:MAG TPA: enoyl-CoA hydratase/isomerase family protein, partial [Alphaproteobacteria bacterium]|nr:enoyl-CoA hydratase/isomerase family protein [Alphaproteobacteria bacterium]
MSEPEVLFAVKGDRASITLNRPKALNALNHAMVLEITARLHDWAGDDAVREVV